MGQITKCDICGKVYNESYLTTHKRRTHGKQQGLTYSAPSGIASVEAILSLFEGLSEDQKREVREVLDRLSVDRIRP